MTDTIPAIPEPKKGWSGKKKALVIGGAIVALVVVGSAIGANGNTKTVSPPAAQPAAVSTPSATPTEEPTPEPEPEPAVEPGSTLETAVPAGASLGADDGNGMSYELIFGAVNFNATKMVMAENQFNDKPPAGEKYIVVDITLKNTGTEEVSPGVEVLDISFVGPDGVAYEQPFSTVLPKDLPQTAPAGTTVKGQLAFFVPADVTDGVFTTDGIFIKAK